MSAPDVVLVTCAELPDGDEDAGLLAAALDRAGLRGQWQVWDDPHADWSQAPAVLRSTWDYTRRRPEFLAWARQVPRLANPADVVEWNSDKVYLRDLAAAGLPVVPTVWLEPGAAVDIPSDSPFDGEVVVKPSVGAGSRGAGRFAADQRDAARAHAAALQAAGRTVMIQPYVAATDRAGETAMVYLDGSFSHAVRKAPLLQPGATHDLHSRHLFVEETLAAREAGDAERAAADRIAAWVAQRHGDLLYARVDLLPGADGPVLLELELVEPSLMLGYDERAADRFAAALAGRIGRR